MFNCVFSIKLKTARTEWLEYQKKKWAWQANKRKLENGQLGMGDKRSRREGEQASGRAVIPTPAAGTLGGFLRKAQRTLLNSPWQIIQVICCYKFILKIRVLLNKLFPFYLMLVII